VAAANLARSNREHQASLEKMAADKKSNAASNAAGAGAEVASARVKQAGSPGAAAAAVKAAEQAERAAQAAEIKKNEQVATDAAQETAADDQANKEASMNVANADRSLNIIKQNAAAVVAAAKKKQQDTQRLVVSAQQAADNSNEYADMDGEDTEVEIQKLKASLKNTKDVNEMVKIFDKIQSLKALENGKPVAKNAAEIAKIRVYKAKESANKAATSANERAEKKIASNTRDADSLAEQEMKRATDAEARTNERSRKTIDSVRSEERKKTTAAQAEADKLAGSLMHFMNVAHEKVFSSDFDAQKAAQRESAKAKLALDNAKDDHEEATLAHKVAATKEASAAEEMSGVLNAIGKDPTDKGQLLELAGQAQAAKTKVISSRTKTQAASKALAEKAQTLAQAQMTSNAAAKKVEEENAKVVEAGGKIQGEGDEGTY